MKTKSIFIAALTAISIVACKNEPKTETTDAPKEAVKKNFTVQVDIVTDKQDDMPLYYTEDGTINFGGEKVVWNGIKALPDKTQTVELGLSEEIVPTNIRIDFGAKQGEAQGDITLEKFRMSYYGKSFEAKGSDFLKYFIKNDSVQTVVDDAKGTITIKRNPKSKLNRFYYPQQSILDEIKKITQ